MKYSGEKLKSVTVTNILLFLFQGKEAFSPELGNAFVFPVIWMLIFLFSAYITLGYPFRNLTEHGIQVITRTHNRMRWWFSKCIFVFCSTVFYFGICFFTVFLFAFVFKIKLTFRYAEFANIELMNMKMKNVSKMQMLMLLGVLPVLTALAVNYIQLFFGTFLNQIYCYMGITILLFASSYFQTPAAIGNFAMVKRSSYCVDGGMTIRAGLIINTVLIVLCITAGTIRIRRYDILKKD